MDPHNTPSPCHLSMCAHEQETEKRLKDIVHGNRKATGGVNGIARKTALQQRAGNRLVVTVRLSLMLSRTVIVDPAADMLQDVCCWPGSVTSETMEGLQHSRLGH